MSRAELVLSIHSRSLGEILLPLILAPSGTGSPDILITRKPGTKLTLILSLVLRPLLGASFLPQSLFNRRLVFLKLVDFILHLSSHFKGFWNRFGIFCGDKGDHFPL